MQNHITQPLSLESQVPMEGEDDSAIGILDSPELGLLEDTLAEAPPRVPLKRGAFSLGQMLVDAGILTEQQVATTQETAQREKLPLWRVLVRDGLIMPQNLAVLITLNLGIPMVDLKNQTLDPKAASALPDHIARRYQVLPIQDSQDRLTVAMVDPTDLQVLQDLAARTGRMIVPVIVSPEDLMQQIDLSYREVGDLTEGTAGQSKGAAEQLTSTLLRDLPPMEVLDMLVKQAIHDRASDIHINPSETSLRVRFRIDGILHDVLNLPIAMHPMLISRIKIMAGMNIAERRRPQDGQFTIEVRNRKVDVRAAVSNTVAGEMAVLRLLDKTFTLLGLTDLGMSGAALVKYQKLLRLPYGVVILCGPTGSGKTTTLYASLLQIDRKERNVVSIEDPVEYRVGDTSQMQVHPEAGVTFATQLRSILRLDPDVILVGEIRDQETAQIAIQASLTGHLVLSSLHANDSISALVRLRDLGVPPYLLVASVGGIVAQRMVRKVCESCKTVMARPLAEQQAYAAVMGETQEQFTYGAGCNLCAHTGYRGRTGVYEVLTMSDALRELFLANASRDKLLEEALKEGLTALRKEGMLKVKDGVTTPYEIMRILFTL
ncbi:MAG: Flp pilus assembly complex ATPase component TadA [Chloroflexi bacterium]|nr:Flp pilus assembly complex ATPase component TadA [Chloroflexota bacterium]